MNKVFNKKIIIKLQINNICFGKHKNINNLGWRILQKHVQKI